MPTFWSKLGIRGRNYGMHEDGTKISTGKKKKKSKKGSSRSYRNHSSSEGNHYENDISDDSYIFSARDVSKASAEAMEYEDITNMLLETKPTIADYNGKSHSGGYPGGMAHYMPKATQHLILSSLLEGEKIDDYFQDCRMDHALKNFARFDSFEQPMIDEPINLANKENLYETIEPDNPPSPPPTPIDFTLTSRRDPGSKLDILNWPTAPIVTSSPVTQPKQQKPRGILHSTGVDSAGEDLEEEDSYLAPQSVRPLGPSRLSPQNSSSNDDSFDSSPWCSGVDVLY